MGKSELTKQEYEAVMWTLASLYFIVILKAFQLLLRKKETGSDFQVKCMLLCIIIMSISNLYIAMILDNTLNYTISAKDIKLINIIYCAFLISVISIVNYIFISVYVDLSIEWDESKKKITNRLLGIFLISYCLIFAVLMITFFETKVGAWEIKGNYNLTVILLDYSFRVISVIILGVSSCKLISRLNQTVLSESLRQRNSYSHIRFIILTFVPVVAFLVVNTIGVIYINSDDEVLQ